MRERKHRVLYVLVKESTNLISESTIDYWVLIWFVVITSDMNMRKIE